MDTFLCQGSWSRYGEHEEFNSFTNMKQSGFFDKQSRNVKTASTLDLRKRNPENTEPDR